MESGPDGVCPYAIQRGIWRDVLLAGLLATSFSARDRTLYLLYHRDCLLRFLRKRKGWVDGARAMAQVIAQFDHQEWRPELLDELAQATAESWNANRLAGPAQPAAGRADLSAWQEALQALADSLAPRLEDPAYHVDPFADHAAFPVFFKIFHGLANQIGLDPTNEAFLYHSLAGVTGEPDLRDRPVRLRPAL
jgi:hypothetical protein